MMDKMDPVYDSPFYNFYKKDEPMTFEQWMKSVDSILDSKTGFTSGDFRDRCYRDHYDGEMTPEECVEAEFGSGDACDMMREELFG